ncbi:hypothetical protein I4U23_021891 [Adineta vaga]|nr:hypothetical protein I4U23_021891 [Adineta vaga]
MSNPTGMHTGTAQHLQEIHIRMLNHINQNNQQHIHSVHGHNHQIHPIREVAHASNTPHHVQQRIVGSSAPHPSTYEFARLFLHYLIHPKK